MSIITTLIKWIITGFIILYVVPSLIIIGAMLMVLRIIWQLLEIGVANWQLIGGGLAIGLGVISVLVKLFSGRAAAAKEA